MVELINVENHCKAKDFRQPPEHHQILIPSIDAAVDIILKEAGVKL